MAEMEQRPWYPRRYGCMKIVVRAACAMSTYCLIRYYQRLILPLALTFSL